MSPSAPSGASTGSSLFAPPQGRYRLLALLDAPKRLINPGCLCEQQAALSPSFAASPQMAAAGAKDKFGGVTAGEVRGGRTKLSELALDDVLAGKYQPPLTLKDFEDFLAFKTKSAENLYFCLAFRKYRDLYLARSAAQRPYADTLALSDLYKLITHTFFHPASPLELNVSSDLRRQLDAQVHATGAMRLHLPQDSPTADGPKESFLHPSAFEKIYDESFDSLGASFKLWLGQVSRNADRNRGWFAIFLGAATYLLGLVPTIVACRLDLNRGYRAIGLFFWWFGIVVMVGGLRRTCLVIFIFGDSRQLYPWEAARQSALNSAYSDIESTGATPSTQYSHDLKDPSTPTSSSASGSPRPASAFGLPDFNFFPLQRTPSPSEVSTHTATSGGLYFAPKDMLESGQVAKSSRVWAPFTRVMSPEVCVAQRNNVAVGAMYGLVAMCLTAAVCFAVPNAHR